jgi:hypothetical protein
MVYLLQREIINYQYTNGANDLQNAEIVKEINN